MASGVNRFEIIVVKTGILDTNQRTVLRDVVAVVKGTEATFPVDTASDKVDLHISCEKGRRSRVRLDYPEPSDRNFIEMGARVLKLGARYVYRMKNVKDVDEKEVVWVETPTTVGSLKARVWRIK